MRLVHVLSGLYRNESAYSAKQLPEIINDEAITKICPIFPRNNLLLAVVFHFCLESRLFTAKGNDRAPELGGKTF